MPSNLWPWLRDEDYINPSHAECSCIFFLSLKSSIHANNNLSVKVFAGTTPPFTTTILKRALQAVDFVRVIIKS
jgi:hypothetical protein